jgi:hypothetical protein
MEGRTGASVGADRQHAFGVSRRRARTRRAPAHQPHRFHERDRSARRACRAAPLAGDPSAMSRDPRSGMFMPAPIVYWTAVLAQ